MISDQAIAKNIQRLISNRDSANDSYISLENHVYDGVRYITFTAMDNAKFKESYTWATFMSDLLGLDDREETWMNPHFAMDWEAVKPYVMDCIDDDEKTPIVLSGHGVAGSVALIAGYYLMMKHKNLQRVVTFGAPPALNGRKLKEWQSYFVIPLKQITKQYALKNDPMPKMFRLTKYCSVNRTVLTECNLETEPGSIFTYSINPGVGR